MNLNGQSNICSDILKIDECEWDVLEAKFFIKKKKTSHTVYMFSQITNCI